MAISTIGFGGPITAGQWSTMAPLMAQADGAQVVAVGGDVTPAGAVRQVSVSAAAAWAAGVYVNSSAATLLTLDAQASGTRRDFIVLRLTWSTKTAVFAIVKGTGTTSPGLTQTPGSVWEIPLATVDVDSSNGVFVTGDITMRKPLPRVTRLFSASSFTFRSGQGYNAVPLDVATLTPGDPGWPYRLRCVAATLFAATGAGCGTVQVQISGDTAPFLLGRSSPLSNATTVGHPARVEGSSGILTGSHGVIFNVQPRGMVSGNSLTMLQDSSTMFQVEQIPA